MKHRDFSELATLLADRIATPAKTAKPTVVKVRQPANDNKPAPDVLAWPALERLAYRGEKVRLFALRHWRDLCFPGKIVVEDGETYEPEAVIELRPSEAELMAAIGRKVIGRERWDHTGEVVNVYEEAPSPTIVYRTNRNNSLEAEVGKLRFRDGELRQWGETKKGKPLRPVERARGARGGDGNPPRSENAVWSYLRLKGTISPLSATPYSKPLSGERAIREYYNPSPEVSQARRILQDLGIDGSVPFEELPFPATRCPDGIVAGPQWVGGVKKPKPNVSEPAGREPDFVRHVETIDYVDHLREKLGKHAKILDMAITDAPAAEIGAAMGFAPAYAAKRGATIIDGAIDKLIEIDDTARGNFEDKSEKIAA